MNKKILYIEISTAHTEIIGSFVEALTEEYEVHLLINEKSVKRIDHLKNKIKIYSLNEESYLSDILNLKKKINPDLLLLNSAQGRKIRDLCLRLLFNKTPIIGVHHNPENIYKSFTQKIIHFKIKKYIVLADFIKTFLSKNTDLKKIKVESFYPLIYSQKKDVDVDSNYKYISIPGVLEQDRRDYLGLIDLVGKYNKVLDSQLKFVLLGNSKNHNGPEVVEKIRQLRLDSRFILFNQYVEDDLMISYIKKSMAIMPLLHPGTRWFENYFETKISGAYNLAFAFNKRLLLHDVFLGKEEFLSHGVYYNLDNFSDIINEESNFLTPPHLEKFNFSFQKKKLLNFLKS